MKYIDAEKLIAEIERISPYSSSVEGVLNLVHGIIASLQQEQPEGDLSEENITKEFHIINDRCFNEGVVGWQKEKLIARHFYELGLNARNED